MLFLSRNRSAPSRMGNFVNYFYKIRRPKDRMQTRRGPIGLQWIGHMPLAPWWGRLEAPWLLHEPLLDIKSHISKKYRKSTTVFMIRSRRHLCSSSRDPIWSQFGIPGRGIHRRIITNPSPTSHDASTHVSVIPLQAQGGRWELDDIYYVIDVRFVRA